MLLRSNGDNGVWLGEQFVHHFNILRQHAHATHAGLFADGGQVGGSVNAVALKVFIVRLDSFEPNPALANWIRRVVAGEMLTRARVAPFWICLLYTSDAADE